VKCNYTTVIAFTNRQFYLLSVWATYPCVSL